MTLCRLIMQSLYQHKKWFLVSVFLGCCGYSAAIFWPLYMKFMTERLIELQITHAIGNLLLVTLALGFSGWVLFGLPEIANEIVSARPMALMRKRLREVMLNDLYQQSKEFFQNRFAGTISSSIRDLSETVSDIANEITTVFIPCFAYFCCLSFFLFKLDRLYLAFTAVWIGLKVIIIILTRKNALEKSRLNASLRSNLFGDIVDSLSNHQTVQSFVASKFEKAKIVTAEQDLLEARVEAVFYKKRTDLIIAIFDPLLMFGGVYAIFFYLFQHNRAQPSDFMFLSFGFANLQARISTLTTRIMWLYEQIGVGQEAIRQVIVPHAIIDNPDAYPLKIKQAALDLQEVSFGYDSNQLVIQHLSLRVPPFQKLGIVGYSGAGKTTFVNLLLRFYDVTSGSIKVDGQDIRDVTQESLRRNIALIPQDTSLFHRSLRDNIRIARVDASEEEIITAAKMAGAHEFIMNQREQYDTLVGERGIKLSGGQRQRIAIARAFLKAAPILILDEATSALDSMTEKTIQEALDKVMAGRTTVVIAHRLSTLRQMNRILVFDHGQIIEDGTHEELLNDKGKYAQMWAMQAGGFLPDKDPQQETPDLSEPV